ncbi:hypothetical protein [Hymenobacter fodinae]|uniref:Uncharacterized protein n=1 Tax=Hymenobacter fodinae TaxID=2510796 RepID=A0A4Z0P1H9_9BACT|nr:hypothetical protein [Hymenobacter fodinae]TGE04642.1 hypothetical protein EU556_20875 [Hymenobacter fodinae]
MEPQAHIIELKFEGNGIKPSKVKASEVAELIMSFEGAIMSVMKQQHASVSDTEVFISFEEIKDQSLSLKCLANKAREYVFPALLAITTSFSNNAYSGLPSGAIEDLKKITKFARRHECDGVWIQDGERVASFDKDTEINISEQEFLRGDTTIYGQVLKAGGDNPRVTLKIDDDYTVSFDVQREIAIKLASNLYKEVGMTGNARWHRKTYKVVDFRPERLIFIEQAPLTDTFNQLGKLFGGSLEATNTKSLYLD